MIAMCLLGGLMRSSKNQALMKSKFNEGMMAPYKKLLSSMEGTKTK
jgi:hypothetical protein